MYTQNVVDIATINNEVMHIQGSNVEVLPNIVQMIVKAKEILKDKKATDADKRKATEYLMNLHMCDGNKALAMQCMTVGKLHLQEPKYIQSAVKKFILQDGGHVPDLREYYKILPDYVKAVYNAKAKARLLQLYDYNVTADQLKKMEQQGDLFIYEYLCTGIGYIVTKKTDTNGVEKITRNLITRNLKLCADLCVSGCIQVDKSKFESVNAWVEAMHQNLFGATAAKHITNNQCTVLNLKPESVTKGVALYTVTKRQTPLNLQSVGSEIKIYPVEACSVFADLLLQSVTSDGVLELTTQTDKIHTMYLTNNKDIVKMCYPMAEDTTTDLMDVLDCAGLLGWNIGNMRIGMYRIDKDDFTLGTIYPETVESVRVIDTIKQLGEENFKQKYAHTVENWHDYQAARMIFNTKVNGLKKENYKIFEKVLPEIENVVLRKDKKNVVLLWALRLSDSDLYKIMEEDLQELFPDLKQMCVIRRKNMPVYFKNFKAIQIPIQATPEAIINTYKNCMNSGVLKVSYITQTGILKTLMLTNNPKILARTYGKNYIGEWETLAVRLKTALATIKAQEQDSTVEVNVQRILQYYDVETKLFPNGYPTEVIKEHSSKNVELKSTIVKQMLTTLINELSTEKTASATQSASKITGRVADGVTLEIQGANVSYYRTLNVNTIVTASYASMADVKPQAQLF